MSAGEIPPAGSLRAKDVPEKMRGHCVELRLIWLCAPLGEHWTGKSTGSLLNCTDWLGIGVET